MDLDEGEVPADTAEDVAEPLEDSPKEEPTPATLPTDDSDDLFSDAPATEKSGAAVLEPSTTESEEPAVQSKPIAPAATETVDLFDDDSTEEPPPRQAAAKQQVYSRFVAPVFFVRSTGKNDPPTTHVCVRANYRGGHLGHG